MFKQETEVAIVGAGIAGISMSYYLSRFNIEHCIFEKNASVGGVWFAQKWPGIRCDTDMVKYSYSFNPYLGKTTLVSGACISEYLAQTARRFGVEQKISFNTCVHKAVFVSAENLWYIYTDQGCCKSRFLVNANGYFADAPHIPEFNGTEHFRGWVEHLARLDDTVDLHDKHVVLVGNGASAISAAPELCARSKSMVLLQRSPSYIFEDSNRIGPWVRAAWHFHERGFDMPLKFITYLIQLKDDMVFVGFRRFPALGKLFFRRHWRNTVDTRTYAEHFVPAYDPWEQRIPVAVGLKEILENGKLGMVTGHIRNFTETGILLADGRHLETDVCILATGYNLKFFKFDIFIDDRKVDTRGINFYRGMMMGGIPNYFQPFGTQHTSFTRRIEVISRLVVRIILYMRRHRFDRVVVERKKVDKGPRITPNYVMRELGNLPIIYGSLELPSIDNIIFSFFTRRAFRFSRMPSSATMK